MNKQTKRHIESLIKESSLDTAPKGFTEKIMQDVSILSNEVPLKDVKLTKLLQDNLLESPSYHFTSNIVEVLENEKDNVYKPIIGKKSWFTIAVSFIGVVLYVLFNSKSVSETPSIFSKVSPYLEGLSFSNISFDFNMSYILVFSLLSLSVLLCVDHFYKYKSIFN